MMKRIDITLPEDQIKKLKYLSQKEGRSVSEFIRRSIENYYRGGDYRLKEFNRGKPFHGSGDINDGKLTGLTDTDYFYFFCPKCGDTQILQVLDFGILRDGPVELYKKERPKAKRDFTIAFELYCPECKLHDFVKVSNIGWAGGKLKDSCLGALEIKQSGF